uniref:Uncharacterized protein n=1 Tax=Arion vulgaris TaxID=1028688 RepID=A0A0B7ATK2_9EUPU
MHILHNIDVKSKHRLQSTFCSTAHTTWCQRNMTLRTKHTEEAVWNPQGTSTDLQLHRANPSYSLDRTHETESKNKKQHLKTTLLY